MLVPFVVVEDVFNVIVTLIVQPEIFVEVMVPVMLLVVPPVMDQPVVMDLLVQLVELVVQLILSPLPVIRIMLAATAFALMVFVIVLKGVLVKLV
jgi:hypothetical protein